MSATRAVGTYPLMPPEDDADLLRRVLEIVRGTERVDGVVGQGLCSPLARARPFGARVGGIYTSLGRIAR